MRANERKEIENMVYDKFRSNKTSRNMHDCHSTDYVHPYRFKRDSNCIMMSKYNPIYLTTLNTNGIEVIGIMVDKDGNVISN